MSKPGNPPSAGAKGAAPMPPAKWWATYVPDNGPEGWRLALRWRRIVAALASLLLVAYLSLATALWAYYAIDRRISGVNWIDIVILPRFSRVQSAIGSNYYAKARKLWDDKEYLQAIFTARAAVAKSPSNLDARMFLASCWLEAGRTEEAVRTLRAGIQFSPRDARLQGELVGTCLATERFADLLNVLRTDYPAQGVDLLDGREPAYQLAELRSVLETADAREAERVASRYPSLEALPEAAPLLSRIEFELGRHDEAFSRLARALQLKPGDSGIMDNYADMAFRLGKTDEARAAARRFLVAFPTLPAAQLRYLEVYGSRQGKDWQPWVSEYMRFLVLNRKKPAELGKLASLAASKGWSDVTFLLYQNSLQENLTGFPFALYYVSSLLKSGDVAGAEEAWHELSISNPSQAGAVGYVAAMVAWANGHESEALQDIDQLGSQTAADLHRRRAVEDVFRTFGFPAMADLLEKAK
jgi:tetratricopeptide (TPR) repeat protein